MQHIKDEDFNRIFEEMFRQITCPEIFDREVFIEVLRDVARLFDLSKGVTEFYESITAERMKDGEVMSDYDDGREGVPVMSHRLVTQNYMVTKTTLYRPKDSWEMTEEERGKLEVVLRALVSFVSRNRLEKLVERLSLYDEAGYPNLKQFTEYLGDIYAKSGLDGYVVLMYNLRNFTLVNSDLGKEVGDIVLRGHFDIMTDTVGDAGKVCRLGGDNFVAAVKKEKLDDVINVMNGVPVTFDARHEKRIMITSSAGVFPLPDGFHFERFAEILAPLFTATQEAKSEVQGNVVYTNGSETQEREHTQRIRMAFPEALKNNEFQAFYQPKVDIATGKVVGAEALCRWIQDGKVVPPGEFIPVLETNSDICRLDFRILEIVCKDIRRWLDSGMQVTRISVNLSRKHLVDVDLVQHLIGIVDEFHIPHEYIEFEFTETTNEVHAENLKQIVNALQKKDIAVTVDDFGMGYSSLNLIREIPWDVIKLDRGFLPQRKDDEQSVTALMYKHVASMANDIGLECVTEGVETKEQVEILRKNNCMIAQGFYYDRPLPVTDFEQRMETGYQG